MCSVYASTKYLLASLSPNPVSKMNLLLIAFTQKIKCLLIVLLYILQLIF